ncbi:flagellar basal body-associated protein FliL [Salinibacillus xinjiangensis]|uniref:Flagellar protein FliL n=1 Tax=Salinibacillus xinjiangensis TaxID=1229268 RepID=A0A6G1X368_9BACI|nr:flagellar basal body-associated protein FliL [Salinibacillus xinjiangensis]MRG85392.1 flagellar basal body-associated protein FliL [Salinibacillus xinjiangensis]
MNKKVIKVMVTLLVIITIVGVGAIAVIMNNQEKTHADGERSIDDMLEDSFETEEITTDLKDGNFIRIKFRIVADEKETVEHLQKDFRLKNIIIKQLSQKAEKDFREGLTELEDHVKKEINKLLETGSVTDVYTTEKILQ